MSPCGKKKLRSALRRHQLEMLEARCMLDASLVISELVAENDGSLLDQNGQESDWIEIFNSSAEAVSLDGLYLTDDPNDMTKWPFPAVAVAAGEHLVIFASGEDLRDTAHPLHTNFQLNRDGEYVALIAADGQSVVDRLDFDEQVFGLSFGRGQATNTSTLIAAGATAAYLIPDADVGVQLASNWTGGQPLNTANWSAGAIGLGFDTNGDGGVLDVDPLLVDFSRDTSGVNPLQVGWQGFAADGATTGLVTFDYNSDDLAGPGNAVQVSISGNTHYRDYAAATGQYAPLSDLLSDGPLCNAACDMVLTLDGLLDGNYEVITYHHTTQFGPSDGRPFTPFNTTLTDGVVTDHLVSENVLMSDNGSDELSTQTIPFAVRNGAPVRIVFSKPGGIDHFALPGIELTLAQPPSILPAVTTNIQADMQDVNSSAYVRIPFEVTDPTTVDRLTMDINYDDGFVAYLNGVEVARRNAPAMTNWSSSATVSRSVTEALTTELIDLTGQLAALNIGQNILAIQGLNVSSADDDFLIDVRLTAIDNLGAENLGYFATPTPGASNTDIDYIGVTGDTSFSHKRGIFDTSADAFNVTIESDTTDAEIVYTVDGSTPAVDVSGVITNGTAYSEPIHVDRTTTLRALAFRANYVPTNVDTQTYLFLDDVLDQDSTPPAGYPATWGGTLTNWGMDQNSTDLALIAGDPDYTLAEARAVIKNSLQSLPTMSIVSDIDGLFGSQNGIYSNTEGRGDDWERAASIEYFDPAGGLPGFQIDAGLRIQGFTSRNPDRNPKHSLRLSFRREYGAGRLSHDLFGDYAASSFDTIVLRSNSQDAWVYDSAGNRVGQFVRDEWARQAQLAMGQASPHGTWVHLYINGLYWGVYNPTERPDSTFNAAYFGGDKDDYEVLKNHEEVIDGSGDAYRELLALIQNDPNDFGAGYKDFSSNADYFAVQGKNPDGTDNPDLPDYIDTSSLIDYVIVGAYAAAVDWPGNNYVGRANTDDSSGFHFFMWDNEHGMKGSVSENRVRPHSRDNDSPTKFYHALRSNEEFRLEFADHLQRSFFNGGPLYVNPENPNWDPAHPENNMPAALWMELTSDIEEALIAEATRWGDVRGIQYTPHDQFQDLRNDLLENWFPRRSEIVLEQFRAYEMYPQIGAPTFQINAADQYGGPIVAGDTLTMTATASVITNTTALVGTDAPALAFVPTDGSLESGAGLRWYEVDFDTTGWVPGTNGVGFGDDYQALIGVDVSAAWNANPTSLYSRFEFDLDADFDSSTVDKLELRTKYDDGYVVYLNGQLVFRNDNAPSPAMWNSRATGTRPNILNTLPNVYETVDLTSSVDLLQSGQNVLAIHVLNHENDLEDILVRTELILSDDVTSPAPIIYTLDGSDPREIGGAAAGIPYDGGIPLRQTTEVNARAFVGGQWSALSKATFAVTQSSSNVVISEINYNPYAPTASERVTLPGLNNDDFEFVELSNTSATDSISLLGMQLRGGMDFTFGNVLLAPGESAVVVEDTAAFELRYGSAVRALGEWSGGLSNGGETLELVDAIGGDIMEVNYDDAVPWPARADGAGASLELIDLTGTPDNRTSNAASWRGSTDFGGSPGAPGTAPLGVLITEVLTRTDPPATASDSIELLNTTSQAIDIGGWYLSDTAGTLLKYEVPTGTTLGPGEYIVFDESHFNPTPLNPELNDFALSGVHGDDVWLVVPAHAGPDDESVVEFFSDDVHFGAALNGVSLGRVEGAGDRLAPLSNTSLGCRNSHPSVGPLVISEINYAPDEPSTAALARFPELTSGDLEFVEIHNPTHAAVDLTDWRVRGGVSLDFDAGTIIGAGQAVVLIRFNPDNPVNANRTTAFREHYGIDESVTLVGGYNGQLSNGGERVTLERADEPPFDDPTFTPHVLEDEVLYDNLPPWPVISVGQSLVRVSPVYFGNANASWTSAAASPGAVAFSAGVAGDVTGNGIVDATDIDFLGAMINRGTTVSFYDLDSSGAVDPTDREFLVENVLGTFLGDANLDGRVDARDLNAVGIHWQGAGDCLRWADGNFDSDRDVDVTDLNVLGINWLSGMPAAARVPRAPLPARLAIVDTSLPTFTAHTAVPTQVTSSTPVVAESREQHVALPTRSPRERMFRRHQRRDAMAQLANEQSVDNDGLDIDALDFVLRNW